jgi:stage II sporulation SpoAA-like protein
MLEFIEGAEDVIAVTASDRITGADVAALMDRLERTMDRHEVVHVFAEVRSLDAVEISGLGSHIARAMPLLGKLKRFGRVAVVADQAWVRATSRIESALLPFVSYRVFRPEQRDEALAWCVAGTTRKPG